MATQVEVLRAFYANAASLTEEQLNSMSYADLVQALDGIVLGGGGGGGLAAGALGVTDRWYSPPTQQYTTLTPTLNVLYMVPLNVAREFTADRINLSIWTAGAAGSVIRLGIYDDNAGMPGDLLVQTAAISTISTGDKGEDISQLLPVGRYWLAAVAQVAAPVWLTLNNISLPEIGAGNPANSTYQSQNGYLSDASVSGALPATAPTPSLVGLTGTTTKAPLISLRGA